MLKTLLLTTLLAGPLAARPPEDGPEQALAKLQGVWVLQSEEAGGQPRDTPEGSTAPIVIKGDRWIIGRTEFAVITVDPGTNPKLIDLKLLVDAPEAARGQTLEGIYKVEGDTLTVCVRPVKGQTTRNRPTEFSSKSDPAAILLSFNKKP